jgi:hypothetical protein
LRKNEYFSYNLLQLLKALSQLFSANNHSQSVGETVLEAVIVASPSQFCQVFIAELVTIQQRRRAL